MTDTGNSHSDDATATAGGPTPGGAAARYPALLFDLDGTLIDSAPDLAAALNRVLAANERAMLSYGDIRGMVGNGSRKLVARGFEATGGPPANLDAELSRFLAIYEGALACHSRLYDGVRETLDRLGADGHRLGLVTNKPARATRAVLREFALDGLFPDACVVGGGEAPALKPDPAPVTALLARLGVPASGAVLIGDSVNDVEAGRAAGVATVAVSYGYTATPARALGADHVVDTFAALPQTLADLAVTTA